MNRILLLSLLIVLATTSRSQSFRVVGNSKLAKIAGRVNGEREKYAITFGKTIFVSCTKEDFLSEDWWVRHEVTHVQQYKKYGVFGFLKRYVGYAIVYRYRENPFEKEAISAEDDPLTRGIAATTTASNQ